MTIRRSTFGLLIVGVLGGASPTLAVDTASIIFETNFGNSQLVVGVPGVIFLNLDASPDTVAGASYRFVWEFTNGNIVGPLYDTGLIPTVAATDLTLSVFESVAWNLEYGLDVTDPDSTVGGVIDFGGGAPVWDDSSTMFEFRFIPTDTGSIHIKDKLSGTPLQTAVTDIHAIEMLPMWLGTDISVVECSESNLQSGDANQNGTLTSSDIIWLVNYVFKSGSPPIPIVQIGDVDCSTQVTSSDIIHMVNFIFKSGNDPCDVCSVL